MASALARSTIHSVIAEELQRRIDLIRSWQDALGLTVVSGSFYFGGMPQAMALWNIRFVGANDI